MAYSAMDIAMYVVNYCASDEIKKPISNLQLQKILYYIQHEFLIKGEGVSNPAFGEDFQAWKYGPVVPEIYNRFCMYGGREIVMNLPEKQVISDSDSKIINSVVMKKVEMKPWALVDATHEPKKAWDLIYKNGEGMYEIIPKKMIRDNV